MTRILSFTPDIYFSLFDQYNRAIWPGQFLAYGLGFIALLLSARAFPQRDRIISVVLAAAWLWIGIVYHVLYFTQINFVAPVFAALFVIQGLLFAWTVVRGRVAFRFRPDLFGWSGVCLAIFAMIVYPLLGWLAGHGWPRSPVFGVTPCPTTIFTWGMLLLVQDRTPLHLTVIPLIWSLVAGITAWLVAIPEDISVPLVGVIAFALILWKNRLAARPNNLATLTRLRPAHGDTHERGSGAGCAGRFPPWRHPVALTKTGICDFGWKARDFSLEGVDGKSYTLADARGPKGTVVVFICNHCPYVKVSIERIADEARALQALGIGTIAVMPNDVEEYPQDSLPNMQAFARKHSLPFPYAIDETQDVARAYGAQCTPDFFGFNVNDELQYRGRLDAGRIQPVPGARRDLYEAMKQVAETGRGPEEQLPSMGCSIKWKD